MPKRGSCGSVLPGCRLSKQYPSINSPAAGCCTSRARRDAHCTLLGSPVCRDTRRLVLASRLPSRAAPTCESHSARCSAGCHTSRDFVPWRFLDAGQLSLRSFFLAGVRGRDGCYQPPPAQIRTSPIRAYGLYGAFVVKGGAHHFFAPCFSFFCSTRAASILPP